MNRLLKAAAALCALAISMSAQVQIGKNVQLGAATAGGAANPAPPAFAVQLANAGVTGFQGDSKILINPTTHTLTAPNVNSFVNSDLFNTGSGNNGVPNAIGSPICASGCTLQIPSNTPNTVDPAGNSAFENSVKTSIWDQTGGAFWYTSNNAQSLELGPAFHFPLVFQTSYNLDPIGVGTETGGGMGITDLESSSGFDITGQPTVRTGFQVIMLCNTPGICQGMHTIQTGLGGDDKGGFYLDQNVRANNTAGASEGNQMVSFEQTEIGSSAAAIVTGGQGTNNILTNVTSAWGVNLFLESSSEVYASGGITSLTPSGGLDPNVANTTDTHAVVNTIGTLTAPCGTPANNNNKIPETCSVTNTGSINKGTFCVTGAWNGSSCVGSNHVAVMIADTVNPECSFITAIGSGTITLGTSFSHPTGTRIFQSPATCSEIFLGDGGGFGGVIQRGFRIAGARTATSWDYIFNVKNDQNGKQQIMLLPQFTQPIVSLARSGTTVTAQMTNASASEFNNVNITGSIMTVCVVGNSNSALNECGVTNIAATPGGLGFTLTWTSTGSGTQTGTGGTLALLDFATHTYPGLWGYEVACGGMVTKVGGITVVTNGGDGSMELEANNCAWNNGSAVVQPNAQAQAFSGLRVFSNAFTPPDQGGNVLVNFGTQGEGWSGGTMIAIGQETHEPIGSFLGYGGTLSPMTMFNIVNPGTSTVFSIANAPIRNLITGAPTGNLISVGPLPAGGPGDTAYNVLNLAGTTFPFGLSLSFDTVANSLTLQGNPTPAFVIDGTLTLAITGSTQCLSVNSAGVVGGTGATCGSGSGTGFPITLGTTSISGSSTTTSVAGLTVNGVVLNAAGSSTLFLNQAGGYTSPAGGGGLVFPATVSGATASGGIPYFSSTTVLTSSALLPTGDFVLGGGAGGAPTATFSIVTAAKGGTGVANTASLTLGSSNQNWATIGTGLVKVTTTTGAISDAVSADIIALWSGTCSSSTFLRGDGACAAPSGSGNTTSTSLTTNTITKANGANSIINSGLTDDGTTITATEAFAVNATGTPSQIDLTPSGTSNSVTTGAASLAPPATVSTAGVYRLPAAPGSGLWLGANSSGIVTDTFLTEVDGDCVVGASGVWAAGSCGSPTFPWSCQPGEGDGLNAVPSGTYLQTSCYNDTGQTVTLTGIKCFTDNSGSSTMAATNGAGTALLTGAVTCTSSFAAGTQSGTTTIASGDRIKFTFVADGTSKQSSWVITGTHP